MNQPRKPKIPLDQNYADDATTVVKEQLAKAGHRLAYVLGRTFP